MLIFEWRNRYTMTKITIEINDEELLTKKEVKIGEDGRVFIGRGYAGQGSCYLRVEEEKKQG